MLKKTICIITSLIMVFSSISITFANNSDNNEKIASFKEVVEQSEYYKDFSDQIESTYAENTNENNEVIVVYQLDQLENPQHTLMFVGNEKNKFVQILEVISTNENVEVKDHLQSIRTRAHLGYCVDYTCTKTSYVYENPHRCPPLIGQACNNLKYIPNYGYYLKFICKAGLIVYCSVDFKKKCTAWSTREYECSIP